MNNSPLAPVLRATPQAPDRNVTATKTGRRLMLTAATLACLGTQGFAAFIPPSGLTEGQQYRIAFLSTGHTFDVSAIRAGAGLIATYNGDVQGLANSAAAITAGLPQYTDGTTDGSKGGSPLTWGAICATWNGGSEVSAGTNLSTSVGFTDNGNTYPIFTTTGLQITDASHPLIGSSVGHLNNQWLSGTETGAAASSGDRPATGSNTGGGIVSGATLGSSGPYRTGNPAVTSPVGRWMDKNGNNGSPLPLYALSGLITFHSSTPTAPVPALSISSPADHYRVFINSTGVPISGTVTNPSSGGATGEFTSASLSAGAGHLTPYSFSPSGTFNVAVDGNQAFTALVDAGSFASQRTYNVTVSDGTHAAAQSLNLYVVDNRQISVPAHAAHVHAGFSSPVTVPVAIPSTGNQNDAGVTMPHVVALGTDYDTGNNVTVNGVAGQYSGASTIQTVNVTFNPGAVGGTVNLADPAVGIIIPEGTEFGGTAESINGSGNADLPYTVYTGQGVWNVNSGGNWSDFSKWTADGGVPGIDGVLSVNDTASFGSVVNPGPATVTLDVSPSIKDLTLNNTSGSYELAGPGTLTCSGTITESGGTHILSAAIAGTASLNKTTAGTLTLSGGDKTFSIPDGTAMHLSGGTTLVTSNVTLVKGTGFARLVMDGTLPELVIDSGGNLYANGGDYSSIGDNGGATTTMTVKGTGIFTQGTGGNASVILGNNGGCTGILNVQDTAQVTTPTLSVGYQWNGPNVGFVNQSGGTVSVGSATAGGITIGVGASGAGTGTYNFDGGVIVSRRIRGSTGTSTFNFNGGTIHPKVTYTTFLQGLTNANVMAYGAIIDTSDIVTPATGYDVTITQNLQHDPTPLAPATDGGLTKAGVGTVILSGTNTYTGPTKVQAGTLSCTTAASLAPTALEIADVAFVNLGYTGTRDIPSLTINGSVMLPGVYGSLASGAPNPNTHLTGTGTVTVVGGSDYNTWAGGISGFLDTDPAHDPDSDGLSNFKEYAFGLDPTKGTS
ncbi:MAG: autotransporter-associated beta strand repeat-containing protein, partial [Verrucomicrobia bacterium]|nr:autotransporter-associated beta strand repeat-containing protein [Verrucomicrobiota bacterium]